MMNKTYEIRNLPGEPEETPKLEWHNAEEEPVEIFGLLKEKEDGVFLRIPTEVAKNTNAGVLDMRWHTAGGRIRFATDSDTVGVYAKCRLIRAESFDIYEKTQFTGYEMRKRIVPNTAVYKNEMFDRVVLGKAKNGLHEITVNMPISTVIESIEIGVKPGSKIVPHSPYTVKTPVVYYGSSITHGYSSSRAGMSYESIISRQLDCDYINLGFSGNCKGEQAIADYISGLKMSAFVLDYDHNAPNSEHLEKTHYNVYKTVRDKNPDLPIIMVTRPDFCYFSTEDHLRRCTIMETYIKARRSGDNLAFYVDGAAFLIDQQLRDGTADGCHPTDLGFSRMAAAIGNTIKQAFEITRPE